MNWKILIVGLFYLLILNSCVGYKEFAIEVFKPAEFSFTADAKKIVLISRNLKYKNDTLQNYYVSNNSLMKDKSKINMDSLAISICMDSLSSRLNSQGHFDRIKILPFNMFPRIRVNEIRPAKIDWYKSIAEKTDADYLILLDMFSCFYSVNSADYSPEAKVITSNIWSVYNSKNQKIIDRFSQIDTLYWNQFDETGNYKKVNIPDKKNAITLAATAIADNYSKHILPSWAKVIRTLMLCDNPDFQKAVKLAQANQWEQAISIWQGFSESNSKLKRASALYNLAVACEMNGDIDKAIEFTDEAAKVSSGLFLGYVNEQVRKYSVVLYQRKYEIAKLNRYYEAN